MNTCQREQSKRSARKITWIVIMALVITCLAACAGTSPTGEALTTAAAGQPSPMATTMSPSPTLAIAPTQSAPTQPSTAQAAPTQTLTIQTPKPAIACSSPAELSPSLTEGPFFKAGSPEQSSLLTPDLKGTKLVLTGYVLTADCKPIAHALLDFWQADSNGNYDNSGYTLRGHQFTDSAGRYQLTTIVPGLYPGRTEHIHVKVQAPNGPILTTQLFFPGVVNNQEDGIFDSKLLIEVQETAGALNATYNFVVSK